MLFHWSLSDSRSPQVTRILISILADIIDSPTCPLISNSSSLCTNPLVTVLSALIAIGITVTFMFHSFLSSLAMCRYLSLFSFSFSLSSVYLVNRISKVHYSAGSLFFFFLLTITRCGHLAEIRWSIYISNSHYYYYYYYYLFGGIL